MRSNKEKKILGILNIVSGATFIISFAVFRLNLFESSNIQSTALLVAAISFSVLMGVSIKLRLS